MPSKHLFASRRLIGAAALATLIAAPGADAQTSGKPTGPAGADALKGDPVPKDLVAPGNGGVAGTGLGGSTEKPGGGTSGTGQSVPGPPGTGIDGSAKTKIPQSP